jgi:hypothetical protein
MLADLMKTSETQKRISERQERLLGQIGILDWQIKQLSAQQEAKYREIASSSSSSTSSTSTGTTRSSRPTTSSRRSRVPKPYLKVRHRLSRGPSLRRSRPCSMR